MVFAQTYEPGTIKPYSRWQVILIAIPAMLAPILAIISAKLSPVSLGLTLISITAFAHLRGDLKFSRLGPNRVLAAILAFAAFSALSALWSPVPGKSLISAVSFVVPVVVAFACVNLISGERSQPSLHMAEGLWLGLLIASVYYVADVTTGQSIKIMIYNLFGLSPDHLLPKWAVWKNGKVVAIPFSDATRNAFAFPLLLWPSLMAVEGVSNINLRTGLKWLLVIIVSVGVFLSPNDTAKFSLVVSMTVFVTAFGSRKWSLRVAILAWFAASFLAVPIAFGLAGSKLENAAWLPANGAGRLKIWSTTASETLKSPIIGVGANATSAISKQIAELKKGTPAAAATLKGYSLNAHAHNIFLQTWFELGFLGAALLSLCGYSVLARISTLSDRVYPYGLATFASGAMLSASSYGFWQFWFLSMFAWTICVFEIGRRVIEDDDTNR
jgi:O-antigen ligase